MRNKKFTLFKSVLVLMLLSLFTFGSYAQNSKALTDHSLVCDEGIYQGNSSELEFTWSCSSPDYEWIEDLLITFPAGVTITSVSDLYGYTPTVTGQEILFNFSTQDPFTAVFTVTIDAGASLDAFEVSYEANGDGWGDDPHAVEGSAMVPVEDYENEILEIYIPQLVDELEWDSYGRRINGVIEFEQQTGILPGVMISKYASLSGNEEFDMPASGDTTIKYTVTSFDDVDAMWELTLEVEAPLTDADLEYFMIDGAYDDAIFVDTNVYVSAMADVDLAKVIVTDLEVSYGATVEPSAVSPTTTDFSDMTVVYTVTAQDTSVKVDYAVSVYKEETTVPVVSMSDSSYTNYYDSVLVQYSDNNHILGGDIAIFHKDVDMTNEAAIDDAWDDMMASGAEIEVGAGDSMVYVYTHDLVPGVYYAYAVDFFENMSLASTDSIVITNDTVEVMYFEDMELSENVIYKYSGEALVLHTDDYRYKKWLRDESMAIEIDDSKGYIADTIATGDSVTYLYGQLSDFYGLLQFVPIENADSLVKVLSSDNTVTPVEVTFEELMEDKDNYQSNLVTLANVMFADADGVEIFDTGKKYDIYDATYGNWSSFRTSYYDADYIDSVIFEEVLDVTGIVGYNWNDVVLTARNYNDFVEVKGSEFSITPEESHIDIVGLNEEMLSFEIANTGADEIEIDFISVDGDNVFRVELLQNITVGGFERFFFNVHVVPGEFGDFEATLLVEFVEGEDVEVKISAAVTDIPLMSYPYSTDFETEEDIVGWVVDNRGIGSGFQWGEGLGDDNSFYRVGYNNPNYEPSDDVTLISPPINLSDADMPKVVWQNAMWNPGYASSVFMVSTDEMETWDVIDDYVASGGGEPVAMEWDLSEYAGENRVFFAFELVEPNYGFGSPVTWWDIDDFMVEEAPIAPIFVISNDSIGMGGSDGIGTYDLVIANEGISYFTVNSVVIKGADSKFTLNGAPESAIDIYSNDLVVTVEFDGSLGLQEDVIVITYNDPRKGEIIVEIPVSAIGVACSSATVAVVGENVAPQAPSWFEYTPAEDALITISSCGNYVDTDVEVYSACDGIMVAGNDDSDECDFPYASKAVWAAKGGITYKILWLPTWETTGFTWTLESESIPVGPELTSISAMATSAETGDVHITFDPMFQIDPDTKGVVTSKTDNAKVGDYKLTADKFELYKASNSKEFTPDGDPEVEPNDGPLSDSPSQEIVLGSEEAPLKITGHMGAASDPWDWFEITLTEANYMHATLELADGEAYLWIVDADYSGSRIGVDASEMGYNNLSGTLAPAGTYYIIVQPLVGAEDPGIAYNLKAWATQPPTFSVYRDALKIANGPMAFEYTDAGLALDNEYCYTVTQEMYDGNESGHSNKMCITPTAGAGDVCVYAIPVEAGKYDAPRAPFWYRYSASETKAVKVSTNIPENATDNDTRIFIYADCEIAEPGNEDNNDWIAFHDDMDSNTDWFTSEVEFVAAAGETYIIFFDDRWSAGPFTFEVSESEVIEGDYVENAIPVTLPLVDFDGTTSGFTHNYNSVSCGATYMGGNDVCYTFDIPYGGTISGGIEGEWVGMHIIKGKPGTDACVAYAAGSEGDVFADRPIMPGTYTIIISTQLPTEETDFVMDLAFTAYDKQSVTYNVDMNVPIALGKFDPAVDSVDVVGTLNFWEHSANLTDEDGDGVYTLVDSLNKYYVGEELRYKYRINADWEMAEFSNDVDVYRTWTVEASGNQTEDKFDDMPLPDYTVTFRVVMTRQKELGLFDAATNTVGLRGSFYPNELKPKDEDGDLVYEYVKTNVPYGDITYIFNVDGAAEENGERSAMVSSDTVITVWFNDDSAVNVGDDLASMVDVYPNPSNGKFTINFGVAETSELTIEVVNLEGRVMKVIDNVNQPVLNVDFTEFEKGVYYLRLNDGNTVGIEKIVLQ